MAGSRNFAVCGASAWLTSLPSVVAISLVEVEIWSIFIFNVKRKIQIVILLRSVTIQFSRLFLQISYYKIGKVVLLQSVTDFVQIVLVITKCDRLSLQSASGITKCDRLYYKVRRNKFPTKVEYLILFKDFTAISEQYFLPKAGSLKIKKKTTIIRASNKSPIILT